jgi:hypothetical protein
MTATLYLDCKASLRFLCYGVFAALGASRFYIVALRAACLQDSSDHSTMASSQDVFHECAHAVRASQNGALLLVGVFTVALGVVDIASSFNSASLNMDESSSSATGLESRIDICGAEWNSCHQSYVAMGIMAATTAGCGLFLMSTYLFMPLRAWSPVSGAAAGQAGDTRLLRFPILSWLILVEGPILTVLGIYTRTRRQSASEPELFAVVILYLILLCAMVSTVIWVNGAYNLAAVPGGLRHLGRIIWSTSHCFARRLRSLNRIRSLDGGLHSSPGAGHLFECYESSLRYQQLVNVLMSILIWYGDTVDQSTTYKACIWTFRVVAGSLLLFTRDAPATFQDLEVAAGFGLVADARQLVVCIDDHLKGQPAPATIRTYKAYMMRMQETVGAGNISIFAFNFGTIF